jgi:hypothetical protein
VSQRVVLKQGESLVAVAQEHGFAPQTLWDHPDNAALRSARENPNVLAQGDVLMVPERKPRTVECATDQQHIFRRRGVPAWFALQLRRGGRPRPEVSYRLSIGAREYVGRTDGDGWLGHWIPANASRGQLQVDGIEEYNLRLNSLSTPDKEEGARSRLVSLGVLQDRAGDLPAALRRFQTENGLTVTGQLDDQTRRKLVELHGK